MILYITVAVSAILIASKIESGHKNHIIIQGGVSRDKQGVSNRICFAGLFTLLFVVSALRIHTGNDYQTYFLRCLKKSCHFDRCPAPTLYGFGGPQYLLPRDGKPSEKRLGQW